MPKLLGLFVIYVRSSLIHLFIPCYMGNDTVLDLSMGNLFKGHDAFIGLANGAIVTCVIYGTFWKSALHLYYAHQSCYRVIQESGLQGLPMFRNVVFAWARLYIFEYMLTPLFDSAYYGKSMLYGK